MSYVLQAILFWLYLLEEHFVDWTSNTLPKPMIVYGKFNEVYTIGGLHYDSHMQCHSRAVYTLLPAQLWNFSCCHYFLCFTKSQTRWNRPLTSYLYEEWKFQFSSRPNLTVVQKRYIVSWFYKYACIQTSHLSFIFCKKSVSRVQYCSLALSRGRNLSHDMVSHLKHVLLWEGHK